MELGAICCASPADRAAYSSPGYPLHAKTGLSPSEMALEARQPAGRERASQRISEQPIRGESLSVDQLVWCVVVGRCK